MATIVVGYDGSDCSRAALAAAVGLARPLGDEIIVVAAYEVNRLGGEIMDFAAALRERAERLAQLAQEQAAGLAVAVTTEVVEETPVAALTDVGDRVNARMIVVGSRGEGPLRGALVGSVPHKLLQVAGRLVLVVPG